MSDLFVNVINRFAASCQEGGNFFTLPTWYKYLDGETVAGKCTPVLEIPGSIGLILLAVIEIMLRIAAVIAVGFVIYGGFRFILSQGDPEQANHARSTVINALIGLVIAMIAIIAVSFAFTNLVKP
jgi:hypothetical protein